VVSVTFILSTQKKFKGFFNISGRFGEAQPLKILLAARAISRGISIAAGCFPVS